MAFNIQVDELDNLTLRKTHRITATRKSTIEFLQQLRLLPVLLTTNESCGAQNNHAWYLVDYNR